MVRKYSGVATRASMEGCWAIGRGGRPFTAKEKLKRKPPRGTPMMAPAVRTPGSAASLGMSRSWKAARAASSLYALSGRDRRKVRTFSLRNPGSTLRSWLKLRSSSPAPARSIMASAIWPMTRPLRIRCPRPDRTPRLPSRRLSAVDRFSICRAGNTRTSGR